MGAKEGLSETSPACPPLIANRAQLGVITPRACLESLLCAWQSVSQSRVPGRGKEKSGGHWGSTQDCEPPPQVPPTAGTSSILPGALWLSPQLRADSHANPILGWWPPPGRGWAMGSEPP